MPIRQYDPKKVSTSVGATPMRGYGDGVMTTVEYSVPRRSLHVGTDGKGRHIRTRDISGTVTVRLASSSGSNAAIVTLDKIDEPYPITITDKSSSGDLFFAASCAVQTYPNMEKSDAETILEWVFQFTEGEITHAGAEV